MECSTNEAVKGFMIIIFWLMPALQSTELCRLLDQDLFETTEPWQYQALQGQGEHNSLLLYVLSVTIWNIASISVGFSESWKELDDLLSHLFIVSIAHERGSDYAFRGFLQLNRRYFINENSMSHSQKMGNYKHCICVPFCFCMYDT